MQPKNREVLSAVLLGGIIAATIDIGAASLITGRSPIFIMQAIAGGLLGRATFNGGAGSATLGAVLQELMGVLIAAIYVVSAKSVPGMLRRWILSGLTYGVIIFFVMNYVVVPLSALKAAPHFTAAKFAENMAAMLLFGLIVACFARRLVSAPPAQNEAASPA
ncbi:MAG TPA: hypothetical protein VIY68_05190 [Steroidobacteraceae bacterium]